MPPKRKKPVRERDLTEIAELRLHMTAREIAALLSPRYEGGISFQTVYHDFAELDRRLLAQQCDSTEKRRERIVRDLNWNRRQARIGWESTLAKDEPDSQFLKRDVEALSEEAKLYGVYAPTKIAPTDPDGNGIPLVIKLPDDWGKVAAGAPTECQP